MFSQKMLMAEPFPSYGVTLLIVRFVFLGGILLEEQVLDAENDKLEECWQNTKHVMYSQFTKPIPDASFWKQCNKHTS